MKKYEPSAFLLWNSEDDDYSVALFKRLKETRWDPSQVFPTFSKDKSEWSKIDVRIREDYISYLVLSKSIEQLIGTKLIPVLIKVVGEESVTRRATLSTIASRINYQHTQSVSIMLKELNPKALIDRCILKNMDSDHLQYITSLMNTLFESVTGLNNFVNMGLEDFEGKNAEDELNAALWKACAIAAIMLEVCQTTPTIILFKELSNRKLDQLQLLTKVTTRDRTIMSSYLALVAKSKEGIVPNNKVEELHTWLNTTVKHIFDSIWYEFDFKSSKTEANKTDIIEYGQYNVNKALGKLGLPPHYDTIKMPYLVEKYLDVPQELDAKRKGWSKWK